MAENSMECKFWSCCLLSTILWYSMSVFTSCSLPPNDRNLNFSSVCKVLNTMYLQWQHTILVLPAKAGKGYQHFWSSCNCLELWKSLYQRMNMRCRARGRCHWVICWWIGPLNPDQHPSYPHLVCAYHLPDLLVCHTPKSLPQTTFLPVVLNVISIWFTICQCLLLPCSPVTFPPLHKLCYT